MQRYLTNTNKRYPPKQFFKTLNLFFQSESTKKGKVLPNLDWSRDLTGRTGLILFGLSCFLEVHADRTISGSQKLLEGYIFAFVKYLFNRIVKMRTKYFKNYVSTFGRTVTRSSLEREV